MMEEERYFGYNPAARIVQLAFAGTGAILTAAVTGHLFFTIFRTGIVHLRGTAPPEVLAFYSVGSLLMLMAISVPAIFTSLLFVNMNLSLFPAITVRQSGFRVHSPIGKTKWLKWSAIKKARRIWLPRESWMIGIKGLGWLYWPTGFFFWLWMPGIHLAQSIQGYDELLRILTEKRPDLFRRF